MINKLEIEGIIKTINYPKRYFTIRNRYVNFSGSSFWSLLKVSIYTEKNILSFKSQNPQPGHLIKIVGAIKVNINPKNQLIPTIIPDIIKIL